MLSLGKNSQWIYCICLYFCTAEQCPDGGNPTTITDTTEGFETTSGGTQSTTTTTTVTDTNPDEDDANPMEVTVTVVSDNPTDVLVTVTVTTKDGDVITFSDVSH